MRTFLLFGIGVLVLLWPILCLAGADPGKESSVEALHPNSDTGTGGLVPAALGGFQLLDPSRFHMSQSYSVTFSSNGEDSQMTGLYLNTISYHFSMPLSMKLKAGYLHDPSLLSVASKELTDQGCLFIPEFEITYRPREDLVFQLRYMSIPERSLMWNRYRSRFDAEWY